MKKYCYKCAKNKGIKDEGVYNLGKCDECGETTGIIVVDNLTIEDIFPGFNKDV